MSLRVPGSGLIPKHAKDCRSAPRQQCSFRTLSEELLLDVLQTRMGLEYWTFKVILGDSENLLPRERIVPS